MDKFLVSVGSGVGSVVPSALTLHLVSLQTTSDSPDLGPKIETLDPKPPLKESTLTPEKAKESAQTQSLSTQASSATSPQSVPKGPENSSSGQEQDSVKEKSPKEQSTNSEGNLSGDPQSQQQGDEKQEDSVGTDGSGSSQSSPDSSSRGSSDLDRSSEEAEEAEEAEEEEGTSEGIGVQGGSQSTSEIQSPASTTPSGLTTNRKLTQPVEDIVYGLKTVFSGLSGIFGRSSK